MSIEIGEWLPGKISLLTYAHKGAIVNFDRAGRGRQGSSSETASSRLSEGPKKETSVSRCKCGVYFPIASNVKQERERIVVRDLAGIAITSVCQCIAADLLNAGGQMVGHGRRAYVSVPIIWEDVVREDVVRLAAFERESAKPKYRGVLRPSATEQYRRPPAKAPALEREGRMVTRDGLLHETDKIVEILLTANGSVQRTSPRARYTSKSSIGRYSSNMDAFPIGGPKSKRQKLEENRYAGR